MALTIKRNLPASLGAEGTEFNRLLILGDNRSSIGNVSFQSITSGITYDTSTQTDSNIVNMGEEGLFYWFHNDILEDFITEENEWNSVVSTIETNQINITNNTALIPGNTNRIQNNTQDLSLATLEFLASGTAVDPVGLFGLDNDNSVDFNITRDTFSTTLSADVSAGSTTINLTNITGLSTTEEITMQSSTNRETKIATGISGSTVTLDSALANSYSSGDSVYRSLGDSSTFTTYDERFSIDTKSLNIDLITENVEFENTGDYSFTQQVSIVGTSDNESYTNMVEDTSRRITDGNNQIRLYMGNVATENNKVTLKRTITRNTSTTDVNIIKEYGGVS